MVPSRGADEVLEAVPLLIVAVGNRLGVLAFQVGDEPGEVGVGMAALLVADQAGGERLDEVGETFDDAVEGLGSEVTFGEELLLAEFKSPLHQSISQEKGLSLEGFSTKQLGYLQRSLPVELENNRDRMNYPAYRRAGLPVTTAWMESLVKEMNYRVKGTEMFWNDPEGAEAILQVRAAALCDDERLVLNQA
jgi:hypothetical protein